MKDPVDEITNVHGTKKYTLALKPKRVGIMFVGLCGNNGTTFAATRLANKEKIKWSTEKGEPRSANWLGSVFQSSTFRVPDITPATFDLLNTIVPLVNPDDLVIGGWDISGDNVYKSAREAKVLPTKVLKKLKKQLTQIPVYPSFVIPGWTAKNQEERAKNIIDFKARLDELDTWTESSPYRGFISRDDVIKVLSADIWAFRKRYELDHVIVFWTASTEKMAIPETEESIGIKSREGLLCEDEDYLSLSSSWSPSQLFARAASATQSTFINGSPQNTFVDHVVEEAQRSGTMIIGDDLKTGQTKMKSVMVDFLFGSGLKPTSIVSYNHLGNNDGKNLSGYEQFKSKEVTKRDLVKDFVVANKHMYLDPTKPSEDASLGPDHVIVIKYVPSVGDSKRALDEYVSDICMGGKSTINIQNTCEDSLLAAPVMLDIILLVELLLRVKVADRHSGEKPLPIKNYAGLFGFFFKAPFESKEGSFTPLMGSLFKQRLTLENFLRVLAGLPLETYVEDIV